MEAMVNRAGIIVLASHNLDLLRRFCNKAIWLKQGQVEEFTDSKTVLSDYIATTRAARIQASKGLSRK